MMAGNHSSRACDLIGCPNVSVLCSKLARKGETDTDFCYRITKEAGVTALPVSSFYVSGSAPRNLIRFCFCKDDQKLDNAGRRLRQYFDAPSNGHHHHPAAQEAAA